MSTHFKRKPLTSRNHCSSIYVTNKLFRNEIRPQCFVVIFFVNVSADRLDSVSQILDKNAFY